MKIAVLPGDGIGPEVTAEAVKVLSALCGNRIALELGEAAIGAAAVEAAGVPLPEATLELARKADAIIFGAVGGPLDGIATAPCARDLACCACARSLRFSPTSARPSSSRSSRAPRPCGRRSSRGSIS